jgi:ABC-type multidrug transport system ATPase subunit
LFVQDKGEFHIENAFAYIDQLDKHAPRLTVEETFAFACRCKDPGFREHLLSFRNGQLSIAAKRNPNDDVPFVNLILSALGLAHVKDTFVGDASVRGVSGGQRRRVTVGEMLGARASVLCGDEISTGLDAASTYDMVQVLVHFNRVLNLSRVISLLQPSPETVSLFDEVIVMAEGMILYAGPVREVEAYFAEIGFRCPQFVDVADFLQLISSGDGAPMYDPPSPKNESPPAAPTLSDLANMFRQSENAKRIRSKIESPPSYVWMSDDADSKKSSGRPVEMSKRYERKYANSFFVSTWLILHRFLILWVRDRRVIFASAAKNIIMGISVGGCYLSTTNSISIQGALFQAGLFIILGM